MQLVYMYIDSPVGALKLVAHDQALVAVMWDNEDHKRVRLSELVEDRQHPMLHKVKQQLEQYFAGQRQQFDLPLDFQGTDFQQQVWKALLSIPYGETRSYKEIALQIGNQKAVRAVGAANGKNPISIIAPCHRVIGSSGALVGFAGGLDKKQILLSLEQSQIP
ncbi:methylated-DNA--[protein]-cysteine S-methyltransferase [bacterium SPL81]|nr:methylated-DNA--[protein]-cysteine S-methyltransferase [Acinetobacter baumannii]